MQDQLLEMITSVVKELNEHRSEPIPTENLLGVGLYGDTGVFDSMRLVNFLVLVEEALEDEYDVEISLTSEKAVSRRVSPFSSVKRLIDFIEEEVRLARGDGAGPAAGGEPARPGEAEQIAEPLPVG
jgi:acyl carrier protein